MRLACTHSKQTSVFSLDDYGQWCVHLCSYVSYVTSVDIIEKEYPRKNSIRQTIYYKHVAAFTLALPKGLHTMACHL